MSRFALVHVVALAAFAGCAEPPDAAVEDPNAGLLRDFLDGKFDSAGHPLNAKVLEAEGRCTGSAYDSGVELRGACELAMPEGATSGEVTVNLRLRVREHAATGSIATLALLDLAGTPLVTEHLNASRLRGRRSWIDLPLRHSSFGSVATIRVEPADGATIDLDYAEVFPSRFGLVVAPGSGLYADTDTLTFEVPRARKLEKLALDGEDLLPVLERLLAEDKATKTTTTFRTLIDVQVGDLITTRAEVAELHVRTGGDAARIQLRKAVAPCTYEGDAAGVRVLVTGFQPFPADGWHENVSAVAVTAMSPEVLRGAQVMRLVLPVEYDRAPGAIVEVIERCTPDAVISFGQGGGAIALEEVAYNLQDTGEIAGGVPDNRGLIRAATPIDPAAEATRDTLLPLDAIEAALEAIGEAPRRSRDPGRYICNNTMFRNIGTMAARGGRGGFIHLPYTTRFDDEVRARFGRVVEAAVQATVDAR